MVAKMKHLHRDWSLKNVFKGKMIYILIKLDEAVISADIMENEGQKFLKLELLPTRAAAIAGTLQAEVDSGKWMETENGM